ncbi:MAG: efflux RND transporter periplasmic adaptor subunit [Synechococcales cyanobacterium]
MGFAIVLAMLVKTSMRRPLLLLALSLLTTACQAPPEAQAPPPTPVTIEAVQQGTVVEQSDYVARVESQQVATLQPQTSGQVVSIQAQAGSLVNAGTVLLTIDAAEQQTIVSSRQAGVKAAQDALASARSLLTSQEAERQSRLANLQYQQELLERNQSLRQEGAVSQNALDAIQRDVRQAQADVAAIEADITAQQAAIARASSDVQQAEANARQAGVQLQFYTVTAPIVGRLGEFQVKVGDYVTPETILTTIRQEQALDIVVPIPLERAPLLRSGLEIALLDDKGEIFDRATTYYIAPQTDLNSQSVMIKARYDNRSQALRAGQFVRARLTWEERPGLLVPLTAISRIAGQNFVFLAQAAPDNQEMLVAAQVPVQLGSLQGNAVQVLQGIEPGQQVVTSGVQKLFPNAPIVPDTALSGQVSGDGQSPPQ